MFKRDVKCLLIRVTGTMLREVAGAGEEGCIRAKERKREREKDGGRQKENYETAFRSSAIATRGRKKMG